MAGYYENPAATAEASAHGWHHTGDIGYLDDEGFLFIVDRAKDMIITGGFNVYSTEVEQALMRHPARTATARWSGCRTRSGASGWWPWSSRGPASAVDPVELAAFVKRPARRREGPQADRTLWPDLPRSKVGKVLKTDIKTRLLPPAD